MNREVLDRIERAARAAAIPAPRLDVPDWLDKYRVIPREYPSAFPGPWRTARTPYLREPLEAFNDPDVETLVLLFSSQIGKTEMILGSLLYAYGADPGPGMFVFPTLDDADKYSTERLSLALRTCAPLRVGEQKSRKTEDSRRHKAINGFPLDLSGANSASSLASKPVRYLWCDEIDRWPATLPNEGDPLILAMQRTEAFRRRKHVLTSTPTVRGASRIEDWYARSDQRRLWSTCPRCGEWFVAEWHHVRWDQRADASHDPDTARLECPACGGRIEDGERHAMFTASEWRPDRPGANRIRGYRTWSVVCPWIPLSRGVESFLARRGDPEKLRTWVNLYRGESWEAPSLKVESVELLARREEYRAEVPAGAKVLTAGVDTQDDRLEVLVIGWGDGEESWVVERETIPGDPDLDSTWVELDEVLKRVWAHELGGGMRIQATLVDCRGHRAGAVYKAVRTRARWRVYASVGVKDGNVGQLVTPPKSMETTSGAVLRCVVGTSEAKGLLYSRLQLSGEDGLPRHEGPGVIHFPMTVGDAFFTELTAEHMVTRSKRGGFAEAVWEMRPGVRRNEALDCYVMALAALRVVCPNAARFADLAARVAATRAAEARPVAPAARPSAGPLDARAAARPRTVRWPGKAGGNELY